MDKRKEANKRVKERITATVFHLLNEKSISRISISEIVDKAGVARASFYRNYSSKEDVITTLIADVLEEFRESTVYSENYLYTYENLHKSFEYFCKYANQIIDIYRFGYGSALLDYLNHFHEDIAGTMPYKSIERYRLYMYIGCLYNTAMMWLINGLKETVDEITDIFYRTCLSGIICF